MNAESVRFSIFLPFPHSVLYTDLGPARISLDCPGSLWLTVGFDPSKCLSGIPYGDRGGVSYTPMLTLPRLQLLGVCYSTHNHTGSFFYGHLKKTAAFPLFFTAQFSTLAESALLLLGPRIIIPCDNGCSRFWHEFFCHCCSQQELVLWGKKILIIILFLRQLTKWY